MPLSELNTQAIAAKAPTSIVVGTDFTPCSAVAIEQAMRIAKWSNAAVHVVHVIDTTVVIQIEEALTDLQRDIRESLGADAKRAWGDFAKGIKGAGDLSLEVSINNRIAGILSKIKEDKADMVIMGAFGTQTPDVGIGTVATACVRKSPTDVLLVRDTQRGPFKTILVAFDFSPTSVRALSRAAWMAKNDGATLHVMHVFKAPWNELHYRTPTPLVQPHEQQQYRDSLGRRLREHALAVTQSIPGITLETACIDDEGHRSGIVEYAKKIGADLLVLGTRGRSNLRDMLLGSTAEKALEASTCSVLAVKPPSLSSPA